MKVEITHEVHWNGEHRDPGAVIEVKETDAQWLISRKKAIPYVEKVAVENRAVALPESAQPKLSKRSWKKSTEATSE